MSDKLDRLKEKIRDRAGGGWAVGFPDSRNGISPIDIVSGIRECPRLAEVRGSIESMWDRTDRDGLEYAAPLVERSGSLRLGSLKRGEEDTVETGEIFDAVPLDLMTPIGTVHTHPVGGWNTILSGRDIYSHIVRTRDMYPDYRYSYTVTEVGGGVVVFGLVSNTDENQRSDYDQLMGRVESPLRDSVLGERNRDLEQLKGGLGDMWREVSGEITPCRVGL